MIELLEARPDCAPAPKDTAAPWCDSWQRRLFDVCCAFILLLLSLPVVAAAAIAIKVTSPGPIFFRQRRKGRYGVDFVLLKLRTMVPAAPHRGPEITRPGDNRLTSVGRMLRRWKIDELPQLVNVIKGEMSMVGPRPEVPAYSDHIERTCRLVLSVRPGVTGPASLAFRDEQSLFTASPEDIEAFYISNILPQKVALDVEYLRRASFITDCGMLLRTVIGIFR
jgi:lipopolysaccharide/colanic/teichoic acid biosynthesis glycosyltransferase